MIDSKLVMCRVRSYSREYTNVHTSVALAKYVTCGDMYSLHNSQLHMFTDMFWSTDKIELLTWMLSDLVVLPNCPNVGLYMWL